MQRLFRGLTLVTVIVLALSACKINKGLSTAVPLTPHQCECHLWGRMFIGFYFLEQAHKVTLAE